MLYYYIIYLINVFDCIPKSNNNNFKHNINQLLFCNID